MIFLISFSEVLYTEWDTWSECGSSCNGGMQVRYRSCLVPNQLCTGQLYDYNFCNIDTPCPSKFIYIKEHQQRILPKDTYCSNLEAMWGNLGLHKSRFYFRAPEFLLQIKFQSIIIQQHKLQICAFNSLSGWFCHIIFDLLNMLKTRMKSCEYRYAITHTYF